MDKSDFFVGAFYVDMKRNQMTQNSEVIAVEPKVLDVLHLLATRQGTVITHDEIIATIWPNTVVAPNALQRCIAQLRKAFGDDAKTQLAIKTHPKKGYSLLWEVRWSSPPKPELTRKTNIFQAVVAVAICLVAYMVWPDSPQSDNPAAFDRLKPLTSTDKPEYYSSFSPDGRYVAFTRDEHPAQGNVWIHDVAQNKEWQTSFVKGMAGEPVWSTDGKQLAFPVYGVDYQWDATALFVTSVSDEEKKTEPAKIYDCSGRDCTSLQWLDKAHVAVIERAGDTSSILKLNIQSESAEKLHQSHLAQIYSQSFSAKRQQLAVMQLNQDYRHELFLLNPSTRKASPIPFQPAYGNYHWNRWNIKWNATHSALLSSMGSKMVQIGLDGNLVDHPIPTYKYVMTPEFHPDGNSVALTLGYVDLDVAEQGILPSAQPVAKTLSRSFRRENHARYQPNGSGVAFISDRGGKKSIWYSHGDSLTEIAHPVEGYGLRHFVWSPDGRQMAVLVNDSLLTVDLRGKWQRLPTSANIVKLFQWTDRNTVLFERYEDQMQYLMEYDVSTQTSRTLFSGKYVWSQQDAVGHTYVSDKQGQLFTLENGAKSQCPLIKKGVRGPFVLKQDTLYWLNSKKVLTSYDLKTAEFATGPQWAGDVIGLSDVRPQTATALVTRSVATHKEIVILH